jgi:hypothetical protein
VIAVNDSGVSFERPRCTFRFSRRARDGSFDVAIPANKTATFVVQEAGEIAY